MLLPGPAIPLRDVSGPPVPRPPAQPAPTPPTASLPRPSTRSCATSPRPPLRHQRAPLGERHQEASSSAWIVVSRREGLSPAPLAAGSTRAAASVRVSARAGTVHDSYRPAAHRSLRPGPAPGWRREGRRGRRHPPPKPRRRHAGCRPPARVDQFRRRRRIPESGYSTSPAAGQGSSHAAMYA